MTNREYNRWKAYALIEPFGPLRDDQRAGTIAAATINVWRGKNAKPVEWRDLLPNYDTINERRDPETLLDLVVQWNAALGGVDKRTQAA